MNRCGNTPLCQPEPLTVQIFHRRSPANLEAARQDQLPAVNALSGKGWSVRCNLFTPPGPLAHQVGSRISNRLDRRGLLGGDLPTALSCLRDANAARVVWSTVDTTGIPLARLKSLGMLRSPLVYTSIGLPERLDRMTRGRKPLLRALSSCERILCYGWEEAERLRQYLPHRAADIHFLPYFADPDQWQPREATPACDVLSVGLDTQRDFTLLRDYAAAHPDRSVHLIGSQERIRELGPLPANLLHMPPVPLEDIPQAFAGARVIALPVRDNSYSGATTTLLQAMAMGRAVVVSETGAIREGYGFRSADACRLAPPSDVNAFAREVELLLENPSLREETGKRARSHVSSTLSHTIWADAMDRHLRETAGEAVPG